MRFSTIAGFTIGAAVASYHYHKQIKQLAYNSKFGMLSQSGMERYLNRYRGNAVDVIFCDGDKFKQLNDAGKLLGYADIYEFSDKLVREAFSNLRKTDEVIEVGQKNSGDEWIILVPAYQGRGAARRLLEIMSSIPNEHERSAIKTASNGAIETLSATIAVVECVKGRSAIFHAIELGIQRVTNAKALGIKACIV